MEWARTLAYIAGTVDRRANDAADHAVASPLGCSAKRKPADGKERLPFPRPSIPISPMSQVRTKNRQIDNVGKCRNVGR